MRSPCVTNRDEKKKVIMRYVSLPDGTLYNGEVFFDMTNAPGEEALDGVRGDQRGTSTCPVPAGCKSSRRKAGIWHCP